jgi:hypothetical protein
MGYPQGHINVYAVHLKDEDVILFFHNSDGCPYIEDDENVNKIEVILSKKSSDIGRTAVYNTHVYKNGSNNYLTLNEYLYLMEFTKGKRRVAVLYETNAVEK